MWSRRSLHVAVGLLCLLCLSNCGFQPLYGEKTDGLDTREVLAQIQIVTPPGREGDQFKANLEDQFYQSLSSVPPRYRLEADLRIDAQPFIIDPDGISSRYDLTFRSNYRLKRISDDKQLHKGTISRKVSYNVSDDDDYATYISELDAKKRGIAALAEDYKFRIAGTISQALEGK